MNIIKLFAQFTMYVVAYILVGLMVLGACMAIAAAVSIGWHSTL